jgi:hypothetical protein
MHILRQPHQGKAGVMVALFPFDRDASTLKMADDPEEMEPAPAATPGDTAPHRTVLYARRGAGSGQGRRGLAVPNWIDLPLLLPEPNPVAKRIQRNAASRKSREEGVVVVHSMAMSKVSRLGLRHEKEARKTTTMRAAGLKSALRRRQSTRVRKLDGLGQNERKNWLREKLRKDLSRFGLWPMADLGDLDDQQSVESAVDTIWTQWQDNAATLSSVESDVHRDSSGLSCDVGDNVVSDIGDEASGVFLTGVPSVLSTATTSGAESDLSSSRRRSSVFTDGGISTDAPEDDDFDDADSGLLSSSFGISAGRLQVNVQTPGLKRRKRLTDLHHFVSTQLQKRLFKSWDSIEMAFTGSGDMTVSQIVKFLQLSDVQLGEKDAAKVQRILEDHVAAAQEAIDQDRGLTRSNQKGSKSRAVLSYEGFRQIFHPVNPLEASKWKREFDREKFRQKQEKDIYGKELAALEERGKALLVPSPRMLG